MDGPVTPSTLTSRGRRNASARMAPDLTLISTVADPFMVTSPIEINVSTWASNLPCLRSGATALTTSSGERSVYL